MGTTTAPDFGDTNNSEVAPNIKTQVMQNMSELMPIFRLTAIPATNRPTEIVIETTRIVLRVDKFLVRYEKNPPATSTTTDKAISIVKIVLLDMYGGGSLMGKSGKSLILI